MGFKDDNGNYVGFDLDLAKEVAKRLNMDIKTSGDRLELQGRRAKKREYRPDLEWNSQ